MLVDLHAHYPMRVIEDVAPDTAYRRMRRIRGHRAWRDRLRALVLRIASMLASNPTFDGDYRVTVRGLRDGGVGVAMSVITRPFDEVALGSRYPSAPEAGFFGGLLGDIDAVEREVATHDPALIRIVHDRAQLETALQDGATALVHAVEGGFSLGRDPDAVAANVAELARRGVAYVTLAHLLYKHVATNANALPFLSESAYDMVFPQPGAVGLTPRGLAALTAMVEHRVLVDIAHMRQPALSQTFAELDRLDPGRTLPVLATHAGYRFGTQKYMLDEPTLLQIKRREGVVGIIMAQHQLNDGLRDEPTRSFEDSLDVLFRHIDKIAAVTGGFDHVAIGTDFDGFIKPTLSEIERMADMARLERALREQYPQDADKLLSQNALRVLRAIWS
jgi:microsomal dipeptidase-like Zn-dependent dipeptidase